jgi:hypothetical protein
MGRDGTAINIITSGIPSDLEYAPQIAVFFRMELSRLEAKGAGNHDGDTGIHWTIAHFPLTIEAMLQYDMKKKIAVFHRLKIPTFFRFLLVK